MWYSYGKSRLFAKRSSYEGYEPFDSTVKGLVEGSKSDHSRLHICPCNVGTMATCLSIDMLKSARRIP